MAIAPGNSQKGAQSSSGRKSLALALSESELRYRRLFETAQDGILILDADSGQIIDVNPFLVDLLGYPFETIIGRQLWDIGIFDDIAANRAGFEELQKQEYIRYEDRPLRTSSGQRIPVEFVSNVYSVGDNRVIQCNIRDIRARSKAKEDHYNARLEALRVAGRAKEHVLAILSHELRTPLSAISAMLDLVELGQIASGMLPAGTTVPARLDRSALGVIRRNTASLVRLVNDLLDLSHFTIGSLQLQLTEVDAHEVIALALNNLEHAQKAKEIAVELRLHATQSHIMAEAPKLEQIASNLLSNAIKFTPHGGTISVVTRNEPDGRLAIEISDSGIGISPDKLERIFAPFEQGDSSIHPRFGGLGLGLSIAKTLVELHGGSLQASSDGIDHGAKFTLRFKELANQSARHAHSPNSLRILLVEDNDDTRTCMAALLEAAGHNVWAAGSVKVAVEFGRWNDFDLLIADIGLPDGTGRDLLLTLHESSPALPAIAVSGYGMPEDVMDSRAVGFQAHLVKPVRYGDLQIAIQSIVGANASSLLSNHS